MFTVYEALIEVINVFAQAFGSTDVKVELIPVGYMKVEYTQDFKSWRRNVRIQAGIGDSVLWTKCCVCKKVTLATLPWWKRVRYVRGMCGTGQSTFYAPVNIRYNGTRIWGMCSDECLNMFYLGNEEI